MSGKGTGKFIVKLDDHTKFGPKLTVSVSKVESGKYKLQIVHPNKTVAVLNKHGEEIVDKRSGRKKLVGEVLYERIVENNNPDEIKAFLEVQAIGNKMLLPAEFDRDANNGEGGYVGGEFANYKTEYQEILFIPAARKGKAKLKTRRSLESGSGEEVDNHYDENDEASTQEWSDEDLNQEDVVIPEAVEKVEEESTQVIVVGKRKAPKFKAPPKEKKVKPKAEPKPVPKVKKAKKVEKKLKNNNKNKKKAKVAPKTSKTKLKIKNKKK